MSDMHEHITDEVRVSSAFDLRMWREGGDAAVVGGRPDAFNRPGAPVDNEHDPVAPSEGGLRALNSQLAARNRQLAQMLLRQNTKNADLQNILFSMDMATLCLSADLKLRFFSVAAGVLFGVGPSDLGTGLAGSAPLATVRDLIADLAEVVSTGAPREREALLPVDGLHLCRMLPILTRGAAPYGVIILLIPVNPKLHGETPPPDGSPRRTAPSSICGLTPRQRQIMDRVLAGQLSKNIAADLNISQRTVENHRAAIMRRTGATSLPALARMAVGAAAGADQKGVVPRHSGIDAHP